jgi:phosphoribosylanthranilate isomerase
MSTWIKICGTTNLEDARFAVAAGANAVGFIFAPSPRQVSAEEVRSMTEQVRGVELIGLFVNEHPEKIEETFQRAALTGVQLHGDEPPEMVASLGDRLRSGVPRVRIIKTLRFTPLLGTELQSFADGRKVDAVLIDTFSPHARGGTGIAFDWEQARESVRDAAVPIIIAGGLNPQNVQQALAILEPWGVDATSGLESRPGKKDGKKVQAFCTAVQNFRPAEAAQLMKEKI